MLFDAFMVFPECNLTTLNFCKSKIFYKLNATEKKMLHN